MADEPPKPPVARPPGGAEHVVKVAPPAGPPDPPPPADRVPPPFITTLQAAWPAAVIGLSYWVGDWTVIVDRASILDVARHLRTAPDAAFDICSDVTATDWPPRAERFDVVYCLFSTRHRHRVRVKARVGDAVAIDSVTSVWPSANWLEREVFDMFGDPLHGPPGPAPHPDAR